MDLGVDVVVDAFAWHFFCAKTSRQDRLRAAKQPQHVVLIETDLSHLAWTENCRTSTSNSPRTKHARLSIRNACYISRVGRKGAEEWKL